MAALITGAAIMETMVAGTTMMIVMKIIMVASTTADMKVDTGVDIMRADTKVDMGVGTKVDMVVAVITNTFRH